MDAISHGKTRRELIVDLRMFSSGTKDASNVVTTMLIDKEFAVKARSQSLEVRREEDLSTSSVHFLCEIVRLAN